MHEAENSSGDNKLPMNPWKGLRHIPPHRHPGPEAGLSLPAEKQHQQAGADEENKEKFPGLQEQRRRLFMGSPEACDPLVEHLPQRRAEEVHRTPEQPVGNGKGSAHMRRENDGERDQRNLQGGRVEKSPTPAFSEIGVPGRDGKLRDHRMPACEGRPDRFQNGPRPPMQTDSIAAVAATGRSQGYAINAPEP